MRLFIFPIVLGVSVFAISISTWAEQETKAELSHHDSVTQIVKADELSNKTPVQNTLVTDTSPVVSPAAVSPIGSATKPPVISPWGPTTSGTAVISPWALVAGPSTVPPVDIATVSTPVKEGPLKKIPLIEVLKDLQEGNRRFIEGVTKSAGKDSLRRKEVLEKESPSAVVLSCSDSRVPPEVIFDRGLGEIYTIRVAGNVLGAASVASIEYAIARLGARLIVILGHESCEIVKAALANPTGKAAGGKTVGSPDLDTLVSSIYLEERKGRTLASVDNDSVIRKSVIFNINGVADRLLQRSGIVRKYVQEGKVTIVRAIYGLESGKVDFWGTESLR